MLKPELRQEIRQRKRQFTPAQLAELSLAVLSRLRPYLSEASVIMAYYSLPDEVDTHGLLDELVAEGKTVLLPKVLDNETMELRRYTSTARLREGMLHLQEPVGDSFSDYQQIDVAVIPGLAFDGHGHRLGRGRGYYDRLLKQFGIAGHRPLLIGLCFDFQKVPSVPSDAHDIPVDLVV